MIFIEGGIKTEEAISKFMTDEWTKITNAQ